MLKIREGDIRLQLQRFLQFVPVISSRELEGKAATVSVGFGDDQCNIPAGAREEDHNGNKSQTLLCVILNAFIHVHEWLLSFTCACFF